MKFNPLIADLQPSASMKAGLSEDLTGYINLAVGLPEVAPPDEVLDIIKSAAENNQTKYLSSLGSEKARQNLIDSVLEENNTKVENISLCNGAKYGIYLSLYLLCKPGDTVLLLDPFWVSYPEMCKVLGLNVVHWKPEIINGELLYNETELDQILANNNISSVILNEANNPSGHVYGDRFITNLIQKLSSENISLIIDEVYKDLVFDKEQKEELPLGNIVRVGSLSKTLSLTGLRIGYVISNKEFIKKFNLVNQHISTCINSVSNYLVENISKETYKSFVEKLRSNYKNRRKVVEECLLESSISVLKSDGTFYLLTDFSQVFDSGIVAVEYLKREHKIIATSGHNYGTQFEKYVRLCTTLPNEQLEETMTKIALAFPKQYYI